MKHGTSVAGVVDMVIGFHSEKIGKIKSKTDVFLEKPIIKFTKE